MNDRNEDDLDKKVIKLMLPGPEGMSVKQLQELFLEISGNFVSQIENCKDTEELRELQAYMRYITAQLERHQKSGKQ